ncbi:M14 family metallopeptidase [Maribacter polysaccharolyticus]|uniref:M14 family metallopeptidase n=1 Tax=Maribacter polysaccharolyticus TaxID=3020831 RepID=UPI00237F6018|nr:M14 metallopeptidase family protein [Maribacter polysaccharolyticus]MDE3740366.1 M14 family metallopeptidase [Maribacter polysaccharolyticus]
MNVFQIDFDSIKEDALNGRYITYDHIAPILNSIPTDFKVEKIGESVNNLPIHTITFGKGPIKILMWSQMHGNESTTTKAIFDLINFIDKHPTYSEPILTSCTIKIIPILNPDGAKSYTRINANQVDLNRDAQNRTQPESRILRGCYDQFNPDFCFNLHGQRTIFNVGNTSKPATVSFLAPAFDEQRNISPTREQSMRLIAAMNQELQELIPGQVGRYDDGFNSNCVGDTFQMLNVPTILFEAGHYKDDYAREKTRKFIFIALLKAINVISSDTVGDYDREAYFEIPDNNKLFYDILISNAHLLNPDKYEIGDSIGILYKEVLNNETVNFIPSVEKIGKIENYFGHKTYDCASKIDFSDLKSQNFTALL